MKTNPEDDQYLRELKSLCKLLSVLISEIEADRGRLRHTQSTISMIEDAEAVALDIINHARVEAQWRDGRIRKLARILQMGRLGPNSYPIDEPCEEQPDDGYVFKRAPRAGRGD